MGESAIIVRHDGIIETHYGPRVRLLERLVDIAEVMRILCDRAAEHAKKR